MRERGGEEQVQPFVRARHAAKQVAHVSNEAEIEHAIRFVDYRHLRSAQVVNPLLVVVDQAPRGADEQIHSFAQLASLLLVAGSAEDHHHAEAGMATEHFGVTVDLHGELARRRDDEGSRAPLAVLCARGPPKQVIQGREKKCGGLARAGLRLTLDVASVERYGQGAGLNGRAELEPRVANAFEQHRLEVEARESHVGVDTLIHAGVASRPLPFRPSSAASAARNLAKSPCFESSTPFPAGVPKGPGPARAPFAPWPRSLSGTATRDAGDRHQARLALPSTY